MKLFSKKPDDMTMGELMTAQTLYALAASAVVYGGLYVVGLAIERADRSHREDNSDTLA